MRGYLFVFEGPDGVGKTSIISLLYTYLLKQNLPIKKFGFLVMKKGH